MTLTYNLSNFDWRRFSLQYEAEVVKRYSRTPKLAAEKIRIMRDIHSELSHSDIEPDQIISTLMETLINNRGEIAAFGKPEKMEEPENLIEGYEWCVSQLSDKTVSREIRSFCAVQVGDFDEMLQEEEIDI